jgi:hypothetical protein
MKRALLAILAVLAMPTMFHLAKMEVSHAHAEMNRSHAMETPVMPECPVGYVCPVQAQRFSPNGNFDATAVSFQLLTLLAAISPLLAFAASRLRYRPPLTVPVPSDPKIALSTFKRE